MSYQTAIKIKDVVNNIQKLKYVLPFFIRINSGGTKLSYSDLLLSIATAQWEEKDAREEIHSFVDEINAIGSGFSFDKDFVLKSCLVLGDFSDVKFKVDNFTKENMLQIERLWEKMSAALRTTIELYSSFGFDRNSLSSTSTVIPVAYYILKEGLNESLITSSSYANTRRLIREWLIRTLLKRVFSGTPDNLYPVMRNIVRENPGEFPLQQIMDRYRGAANSIQFSEEDIDLLLNLEYKSPFVYSVLALLYPGLNNSFHYPKDHIHPQMFFTEAKLRKEGITDSDQIREYQSRCNRLPNLQLLQSTQNTEKNGKKLADWLPQVYPDPTDRAVYRQQHLFPAQVSLEFSDFVPFFEARKELSREKLRQALGVPSIEEMKERAREISEKLKNIDI